MPEQVQDRPQVRISGNQMEAYLWLPVPMEGEAYTIRQMKEILASKGVKAGIDDEKLYNILEEKIYAREVLVAEGQMPTDGVDGRFEFLFNRELNNRPKVLSDGSVDYWSMNLIEQVHAGQQIARYVPAVQGVPGFTVKGVPKPGKRGKELPPLKGKGFVRSGDNITYTAVLDGKIDMSMDRITILPTYEIFGNADVTTGNIDFVGDVIVHGNIASGVLVKATGNITIDGIVEAAVLEAGKDIVLRSGMMGGQKAVVTTKGNIFAKFFEYTTIEAKGSIQADVLMECQVTCGEQVILNGNHGSVVGGFVRAVQGLEAAEVGNDAEVHTDICVGVEEETLRRANILEKKIDATRENLETVEDSLMDFQDMASERGASYKDDPRRLKLLRLKIQDSATLARDQAEYEELQKTITRAKDATVKVFGTIYPGVMVQLNDARTFVKADQHNVEYILNSGRVAMCALGEVVGL